MITIKASLIVQIRTKRRGYTTVGELTLENVIWINIIGRFGEFTEFKKIPYFYIIGVTE